MLGTAFFKAFRKMNVENAVQAEIVKMRKKDIKSALAILTENKLEAWSYNDFFSEMHRDDSIVLAAIAGTEIIGFCVVRLIIPNSYTSTNNDKDNNYAECEVYNIAVKKKFQDQGIGKKMLNELVLLAKERHTQSIWLEVRYSNSKAINFYQRNNFRKIYERKNFYSNPSEDAIVLKRDLIFPSSTNKL
jgi:ribosomal-protein-alanine N-acetyltransferase